MVPFWENVVGLAIGVNAYKKKTANMTVFETTTDLAKFAKIKKTEAGAKFPLKVFQEKSDYGFNK